MVVAVFSLYRVIYIEIHVALSLPCPFTGTTPTRAMSPAADLCLQSRNAGMRIPLTSEFR